MTLTLMAPVDSKLAEQGDGNLFRSVTLLGFGKEGALHLRGTECYVADDILAAVYDHVDAGRPRLLRAPGVPAEPRIHALAPAV